MRTRAARLLRRVGAASVAGLAVMSMCASSSRALVLQQAYVHLQGEGAWSITQELVSWQNELATSASSVDLNYAGRGSYFGREDLIAGQADFAISGIPMTADQLARVPGGDAAFVSAPVDVAALGVFVSPPVAGFNTVNVICDPDDPNTWPQSVTNPDGCVQRAQFNGTPLIPNRSLAGMLLNYNGASALTNWNNPDLLAANGLVEQFQLQPTDPSPGIVGRSDPDETNYYLQKFVKNAAPDVWTGIQHDQPAYQWEPITERIAHPVGTTRDGAEQEIQQLRGASLSGGIAPAPVSEIRVFRSAFPNSPIGTADVRNANGDWVAPTPKSIDAAVDVGGAAPLYALTNRVAGAYPLVWIDRLYAPAHGLSIEKTEGLATLIRYLATTGQEKGAAVGDGRLTPSLTAEALQAADQLEISNCVGSDRRLVVNTDPGPLAPATTKAMTGIGRMAHCVPAPGESSTTTSSTIASAPTTTTTTATATATAPSAPLSAGSDLGSGGAPVDSTATTPTTATGASTPATAATESGGKSTATTAHAVLTAERLPLPLPGSSSGADRLATFLLGAALYLLLRKPVIRVFRNVVS